MVGPAQKSDNGAANDPPKYGKHWSQGAGMALLLSLGFWAPIYLEVEDQWPNAWWSDFALAFIISAAFLSLSWLTGTLSEYLEKRDREVSRPK
ncbi:MAG TPA: hypothetical protein VMB80_09280 [Candidatus Acidoferrum sp.]|nr:hypothetical protein [Candidatus Acidoferrum sp.]